MHNSFVAVDLGYCHPDGSNLFSSLNFSFSAYRIGLVGPNGIGKSTLLDILSARRLPATGSLVRPDRIGYLPQDPGLQNIATVADLIQFAIQLGALLRIDAGQGLVSDFELVEGCWDLPERISQVFELMGIESLSPARPVASLGGGELTRVRFAGMLLHRPNFLLLDEPTNHLDLSAREFVYDFIRSWTKGLVVVSHDRALLGLVDLIAELRPTELKMYGGSYDFYQEQKEIEKAASDSAFQAATQRLEKAQRIAREAAQKQSKRNAAGRTGAKKGGIPRIAVGRLQRKAETTSARVKGLHEVKLDHIKQEVNDARLNLLSNHQITIDLGSSAVPLHKRMVEVINVNYHYPDVSDYLWPEVLTFDIVGPERVRLSGPNGAGKSTLIDLITGNREPTTGTVRVGSDRIAVLDQATSQLDGSLTILENIKCASLRPEHELRILLGRFLFEKETVFKPAKVLSGGERMRAALACMLAADQFPQILILDEPTNNLDLASIEELVSVLRAFEGTLIAVSHDESFLAEIGIERIVDLKSSSSVITR